MSHVTEKKPVLTAFFMGIITIGLIALEIYVDISTGIENATTEYQKNVMGWMGFFLGSFSAISVLASGALKQMGKMTAFYALLFLSTLLVIYSYIVWISFFCTVWIDYSTRSINSSIQYQAKAAAIEALKNMPVDVNQVSSDRVSELNRAAISAELALKKCSNIKSDYGTNNRWQKISICKSEQSAKYKIAAADLEEIKVVRDNGSKKMDAMVKLLGESSNSVPDFIMMPLASIVTDSKESGKTLMLSVAIFMTFILAYITNSGLYFVGSLIGGGVNKYYRDEFNNHQHKEDPVAQNRSFTNSHPTDAVARDRNLSSANIYGATAFHDEGLQFTNQANTTAISGVGSFKRYDNEEDNQDPVNTTSPYILSGAGFAAQEIPNPNYKPTDADAVDDCVRLDADALAKNKRTSNAAAGRGIDKLLEFGDLVDAIMFSTYLEKSTGVIGQNRIEEFMGVGRPVAKRYMAKLVEKGIIDEKGQVVKCLQN
jgi:hypothetical protein